MEALETMEENKKTLFDHLTVIYYRKWLFVLPLLFGATAGFALSLKLPKYYTSSTLIVVEEQQVPVEYVMPTDTTPFNQRLNLISQQILSRTRLEEIIKKFNLYPNGERNFISKLSEIFKGDSANGAEMDEAIEQMRLDIKFEVMGDTGKKDTSNAFSIMFTGRDPGTTMEVTNMLGSLFIQENLRVKEESAEGTAEFLSNELDRSKTELETLEKALKDFKESHMGTLPEQMEANLRTLDRLQLELQTLNGNLTNAEDRKAVLEEQLNIIVPITGTGSSAVNPMVAELDKLKSELGILLTQYKESYPDVMIARKRINEIEDQLARDAKEAKDSKKKGEVTAIEARNPAVYADLMGVKSQIASLREREANVRKQIRDYEERVEQTPSSEQKLTDLLRDYKISFENYQALLEKKMSARLAENLEKRQQGERFRVIDPAYYPQKPDSPDKVKVTLAGTVAGGAFGTGLVFLLEFLSPAFRKPEDFDGVIPAPVLTSIPVFLKPKKNPNKLKIIKGRKDIA